jgi:hypothetical protein
MRTLLRSTATGLFFQGPDKWTSDPGQALDFKMIDRALDFIDTWKRSPSGILRVKARGWASLRQPSYLSQSLLAAPPPLCYAPSA